MLHDYQIGGVNNSLVTKGSEASGIIIYVTVTTPHTDQPRRVKTIDIFLWLYRNDTHKAAVLYCMYGNIYIQK